MCGLLTLKQLYFLSGESIVEQWRMNVYCQMFCGEIQFQTERPCHVAALVKFRQHIGVDCVKRIFGLSVGLHGKAAQDSTVLVDSMVQEKVITYLTYSKLLIKIINRINKHAKTHHVEQRRTFAKEAKPLRLVFRHFRHARLRSKAKISITRLRRITGILMCELERQIPASVLVKEKENFALYLRVIGQRREDKNKEYSLHKSHVYCVGKGKDHKAYEYGRKASVVSTQDSNIIVVIVSHDKYEYDSKTHKEELESTHELREKPIELALVGRGYREANKYIEDEIGGLQSSSTLKRDAAYQWLKKRILCRRRAAIELMIGYLKHEYRLSQNWLEESEGDAINLLIAACGWNLRKRMVAFFLFENEQDIGLIVARIFTKSPDQPQEISLVCSDTLNLSVLYFNFNQKSIFHARLIRL